MEKVKFDATILAKGKEIIAQLTTKRDAIGSMPPDALAMVQNYYADLCRQVEVEKQALEDYLSSFVTNEELELLEAAIELAQSKSALMYQIAELDGKLLPIEARIKELQIERGAIEQPKAKKVKEPKPEIVPSVPSDAITAAQIAELDKLDSRSKMIVHLAKQGLTNRQIGERFMAYFLNKGDKHEASKFSKEMGYGNGVISPVAKHYRA